MPNRLLRLVPLAAAALIAACSSSPRINDIMSDPRGYVDSTVTVDGKVTDAFSLVLVKYYTVSDGSGSINVVTGRTLPAVGQKIRVRGKITEVFSIGPKRLIVLVEDDGTAGAKRTEGAI